MAEVDLITSHRTPQTRLAAIYLLMPTSQNVGLVLSDFRGAAAAAQPPAKSSKKKDSAPVPQPEGPKYASAYLHFVDGQSRQLGSCPIFPAHVSSRRYRRQSGRTIDECTTGQLSASAQRALHQLPRCAQSRTGRGEATERLTRQPTALEARAFTLKMPRSFFNLYAPPERSPQESFARWEDDIGWMSRAVRKSCYC